MVGDTCRADADRLVPPHQEPDSLLRTGTSVEADGASFRGAVLGVSGSRRRPCGSCRRHWLWSLRRLASHRGAGSIGGAITELTLLSCCLVLGRLWCGANPCFHYWL